QRQPLVLNLEEKVVFAEYLAIGTCDVLCRIVLRRHQVFAEFPGQTPGKPDQSLGVFREKFLAYPWFVIEPIERSFRSYLDEVPISLFVLRQNQQMVISVAFRGRAVVILFADVKLAADNWLDALVFGGIVKADCAKDVAMIGHSNSLLADVCDTMHEL